MHPEPSDGDDALREYTPTEDGAKATRSSGKARASNRVHPGPAGGGAEALAELTPTSGGKAKARVVLVEPSDEESARRRRVPMWSPSYETSGPCPPSNIPKLVPPPSYATSRSPRSPRVYPFPPTFPPTAPEEPAAPAAVAVVGVPIMPHHVRRSRIAQTVETVQTSEAGPSNLECSVDGSDPGQSPDRTPQPRVKKLWQYAFDHFEEQRDVLEGETKEEEYDMRSWRWSSASAGFDEPTSHLGTQKSDGESNSPAPNTQWMRRRSRVGTTQSPSSPGHTAVEAFDQTTGAAPRHEPSLEVTDLVNSPPR